MLKLRDIKVLHLEPTDVCQAECALCARETDPNFNKSGHHHLTMDKILKVFDHDCITKLDKMFMCGNYGDPAAGKYTLNIYQEFRKINPNIVLGMNTNGALQNTSWWVELGKIMSQPQDYVVFSIDGLEDTNAIYRRGVNWSKLMTNATSYIESGGSAHWDMLVYEHNQHQVDQCQTLAQTMGFKWFRAKVSKRKFQQGLRPPLGWKSVNLVSNQIKCHALNEQSVYIDAQGRISPCCWLGARQKDFIKDFETVKQTWNTPNPNKICAASCSVSNGSTNFQRQWQREVQL
jgi:hypothetical protein